MAHQLISRRVLATGTAGAVALCVAAVGAVPASATPEPAGHGRGAAGPERSVAAALRLMSTQEKVGQLFTQNVYGSDATTPDARNLPLYGVASPAEVVRKYHLGGVIYFAWTDSVKDPAQITALSNGLQRAAIGSGAHIPLTVGTDQEQGVVTRVGPPATQFPGSMALGASRSTADARTAAAITGRELKAMGINVDYAPDADVNVNPLNPVIGTRSFSSDPALVSAMVSAQVTGYQKDAGIVATPKHFPGHGDTATDSHTGIPVITHTREQWLRTDAPPFKAAISAGADMIMSGHLVVPALDPSGDPATLSKPILTGILRQELGFKGVITTDSLAMQGVREKYGDGEVAVRAVLAGADSLMMAPDMDAAYGSVLSAVQSGRISQRRLDESVARILLLKLRRGILTPPVRRRLRPRPGRRHPRAPGRRGRHHRPHHDRPAQRRRDPAAAGPRQQGPRHRVRRHDHRHPRRRPHPARLHRHPARDRSGSQRRGDRRRGRRGGRPGRRWWSRR